MCCKLLDGIFSKKMFFTDDCEMNRAVYTRIQLFELDTLFLLCAKINQIIGISLLAPVGGFACSKASYCAITSKSVSLAM